MQHYQTDKKKLNVFQHLGYVLRGCERGSEGCGVETCKFSETAFLPPQNIICLVHYQELASKPQ